MKQVYCSEFGPPEALQRNEVPQPVPRSNEALVNVSAAGVGYVDGLVIQGLYQVKPALPYLPGSEISGTVTAIGSEVNGLEVGDSVLGLVPAGGFADYVCVRADNLYRYPDALSAIDAAGLFVNYATALYGLRDCGDLQPEQTVLVLGAAGGVGSAAIAVAKAMGARVIAAASNEPKRTAAASFGADHVLDYTRDDWRDNLRMLTSDTGLDLAYDPVGGPASETAFRSLSPGGKLLVVGFASGEIPRIALNLPLLKRAAIVGVDWGGESRVDPSVNKALMQTILGWIESARLKPAAVSPRPMADFQEALRDQLEGRIIGKLVLYN